MKKHLGILFILCLFWGQGFTLKNIRSVTPVNCLVT